MICFLIASLLGCCACAWAGYVVGYDKGRIDEMDMRERTRGLRDAIKGLLR